MASARDSSAVAPGTLYVFLSEGTRVITAPHGRPKLGIWKQQGGFLTLIEQNIPYRIDVLALSDKELGSEATTPASSSS